jgi:hypothetical protein
MHIHDLPVLDYFSPEGTGDLASLGPTWQSGYFAATVSIDVVWSGPVTRRVNVKDAADGFAGTFAENQATVTWSAQSDSGFSFVSDVGSFATSVPETPGVNGVTAPLNFFAEVGHERNGAFFPAGSKGLDLDVPGNLSPTTATAADVTASEVVHALLAAVPLTAGTNLDPLAYHGWEGLSNTQVNPSRPMQVTGSSDQPIAGATLAQTLNQVFAVGCADTFTEPDGYFWAV